MSVLDMKGVLVGVLATITMDGLTSILYKLQLVAPLHPRLVGRWLASIWIRIAKRRYHINSRAVG